MKERPVGEFLEPDEIRKLTAYTPAAKQDAWLTEHGIPHRLDRRRVIVSREHVRAWLEGRPLHATTSPNWGAVNA